METTQEYGPGAPVSWTKLKAGKLLRAQRHVECGPLSVGYQRFNVPFAAEGRTQPGSILFGVLDEPGISVRWNGRAASRDDVITTRGPFDVCTAMPEAFYTVLVREDALPGPHAALAATLADMNVPDGPSVYRNARHVGRLRAHLRTLVSGGVWARALPRELAADLVPLLTAAVTGESTIEPTRTQSRRIEAVRLCQQHIRDRLAESVTLADLSALSGLRPRSLINAFEAVTGTSPMAYLRAQRLNRVREILARGRGPKMRIIDIAADWGFWHMGHFSAAYRALFGETPSMTIARSRDRAPGRRSTTSYA